MRSDDPRKPALVAAIKAATGATRVTNVRRKGATYRADCLTTVREPGRKATFRHIATATVSGDGSDAYPWFVVFERIAE